MKRKFPLPLKIDCGGLSTKLIGDLADRLAFHFEHISISGDEIIATNPLDMAHYDIAWRIIDRFGVKAF